MGGLRGCWVFPLAFLARLWLHALPVLNPTRFNRNVVSNWRVPVSLKTGLLLSQYSL